MLPDIDPKWAEWIAHHGAVFGMTSAADTETLYAWAGVFATLRRAPWELVAATNRLAATGTRETSRWATALQWREGHLHALKTALRDLDEVEARKRFEESRPADGGHGCGECQDAGWVVVPATTSFQGRSRRTTCAVLCRCPQGARRWESCRDLQGTRPWSLEQYEEAARRAGVDWRALAREWHQEASARRQAAQELRRAEETAQESARRADASWGPLEALAGEGR